MKKLILLAIIFTSMQMYSQVIITEEQPDSTANEILYSTSKINLYKDKAVGSSLINTSERLRVIPKDEKLILLKEYENEYKIVYNNQVGYIKKFNTISGEEFEKEEKRKKEIIANMTPAERREYEEREIRRQEEQIKRQKEDKEKEIRRKALVDEYGQRCGIIIYKYGMKFGRLICNKEVAIGMTMDMVRDSWGKPTDVNRTRYSWGTNEQWVYGLGKYIYFENNKVTAIQD